MHLKRTATSVGNFENFEIAFHLGADVEGQDDDLDGNLGLIQDIGYAGDSTDEEIVKKWEKISYNMKIMKTLLNKFKRM